MGCILTPLSLPYSATWQVSRKGPSQSVALILPCARRNQEPLRWRHHAIECCLPNCSSYCHTIGYSDALRDVMGFFRFAGGSSSVPNPRHAGPVRSRWPEVLWRRCSRSRVPHQSLYGSSLLSPPHFQSQPRATSARSPDRAPPIIQRPPLSRRSSGAASAFRRWLLPTVERGPPIAAA